MVPTEDSGGRKVLLVGAVSGTPGVGGVAHVQRRTAMALHDLGVDVVEVFRTGRSFAFVRTADRGERSILHEVSDIRAVRSALDRLRPDVVHVMFAMTLLGSGVAAWARRQGVPVVAHPEGALDGRFLAHHRLRKYPYLATIERPLRRADAVVSVTEGDLADNRRWFSASAEHVIVPNIVEPPSFAPTVRKHRASGALTDAIYFGRINDYHKGVSRLVALARRMPDVHFSLVGTVDVSDRVALDALAGMPANVELIGPLHGDDLYRRVADADFFVHPARFEAFGNTIPEALGVSCPVFVSEETYLSRTLRSREFGHVLDFDDIAVAEAELRRCLSQPDELRRRTERGASWVREELSAETVGTSLVDVYERVISRVAGVHRSLQYHA
jgi:glycosyltransferase involved in cell wall biosynthesis